MQISAVTKQCCLLGIAKTVLHQVVTQIGAGMRWLLLSIFVSPGFSGLVQGHVGGIS